MARKPSKFANHFVNNSSGENFTGLQKTLMKTGNTKCGAVQQQSADYSQRKMWDFKKTSTQENIESFLSFEKTFMKSSCEIIGKYQTSFGESKIFWPCNDL